jgi:hypothetical protein
MGDGTGRRWSLRRRSLGWSGPHGYWLRLGRGSLGLGRRNGSGLRRGRSKPAPTRVRGDYNGEDSQYYFRVQKVEEFDLNRDLIKE